MSPRPSSPTSLLTAEPSLMNNNNDELGSATKDSFEEEMMLSSTADAPVPIETAYAKAGFSVDRPKKRFGSASYRKDDAKTTTEDSIGIGEFSQSSLLAAITHDDNEEEQNPKKRSWELDEFGDDDDADDELMLDSQGTADSMQNQEESSEVKDSGEEVDKPNTSAGVDGADLVRNGGKSDEAKAAPEDSEKAQESAEEAKDEEKEESPVERSSNEMDAEEPEKQSTNDSNDEEEKNPEEEKSNPSIDDLKLSIEYLFCEADKQTVTVKHIFSAVEAEHSITLNKANKKILRAHLVALMQGKIKPSVGSYMEDADVGDDESESSSDESSDEEEQPSSEYEDEEEEETRGHRTAKKKKSSTAKASKKDAAPTRRKSTRKPKKAKKGSIHAHAEKLRQKRMQELRVRNEELQLAQNAEDQKRAEMIAAKFETNTDELRLERLEARLDLLQQLDQKRLKVMSVEGNYEDQIKKEPQEEEEEEDSDSDDDGMELEIVGPKNASKPLFPSITAKPAPRKSNALSVLDLADKVSPMKKDPSKKDSLAKAKKQRQLSPSRRKDARAILRNSLKSKQRKMGNMWLARELGYKNEKEHLRDCWETEKKKREQILRIEAERLAANERTQLRERFREPESEAETELGNGENPESDVQEEEDEELQLARQMEKEKDEENSGENIAMAEGADTSAEQESLQQTSNNTPHSQVTDAETGETDTAIPVTDSETGDLPANEDTQESTFPDAQDDMPVNMDFDDSVEATTDTKVQQAAKEIELSAETSTESQESSQLETQQFETQAPFPFQQAATEEAVTKTNSEKEATSNGNKDDIVDTDDEKEFDEEDDGGNEEPKEAKKDRNAAWKAMLQKEADKLKKTKKGKGGNEYLEAEAEEEEEEEVAGLEDFGFSVHKKKGKDDDEDDNGYEFNEDDLKDVVDDVSDDEGDEETGEKMRRKMAEKEEKERHKEMLRRMREGYDGRRGGIAGGGAGARGMHRFDQLVAADNKETAKRLGLLNDDELDSDDEENGVKKDDDEEEDEAALIDKMLKDRFLHRSSVEFEENFSDDEEDEEAENNENGEAKDVDDDQEQERLAKRFAKRARMQRLMEEFGENEEFSDSRLIEEDTNMKEELARMKNGLARKRSMTSVSRTSSISTGTGGDSRDNTSKRQRTTQSFSAGFMANTGSLSLALQSSRQQSKGKRTSFLGSNNSQSSAFGDFGSSSQKSISFNHVVFQSDSQMSFRGTSNSQSHSLKNFGGLPNSKLVGARRPGANSRSASLWSKVMTTGPQKRR